MAAEPRVRWRDAASPGWRELLPSPAINPGFEETGHYILECAPHACEILVDDEPLKPADEDGAGWRWMPGFFAGQVVAEVVSAETRETTNYLLDVSPNPRKLGGDIFKSMVDDLLVAAPALVFGEEPATILTGEISAVQNPWIEFARLRRYGPTFVKALSPICAHPRRTLRVRRTSAGLHQVRRVDRRTAVSLLRSSAVALMFGQVDEAPAASPYTRLDVPSVEETVDSAANRAILALIRAMRHRARVLQAVLEARVAGEADSETRTGLAERWPVRRTFLVTLQGDLRAMMRRRPFSDVTRAEASAAGLNAISADPMYSRAWGQGWRALRHGAGEAGDERLWISPTWEIYERWCFVESGRLLRAALPSWQWELEPGRMRWAGRVGVRRATLSLQPTFGAYPANRSGRWSVSRERVPDMVLTAWSDPAGADLRFAVIDAKYRVSRAAVLDAMQSAHVYQDALRIGGARPGVSLLAVPASGGAPWLEDGAVQREHRVGVWVLSPQQGAELPEVLTSIISPDC